MQAGANTDAKNIVAKNVCRLMVEQEKTRRQICEDLQIKYTTFCDWLNGNSYPKLESLETLAGYFGVGISDFFIECDAVADNSSRLIKYLSGMKVLNMGTLEKLSDSEIRELLAAGFRFKHKTLEEYINESGGQLRVSEEFDWGQPVGDELW